MNAEQYRRANKSSFIVCMIVLACGLLLTVFSIFQNGPSIGRISIIAATVISAVMVIGKITVDATQAVMNKVEEVASLSNEGAQSSDIAVEKFEAFKAILLNIFQEANKLRDMQTD